MIRFLFPARSRREYYDRHLTRDVLTFREFCAGMAMVLAGAAVVLAVACVGGWA